MQHSDEVRHFMFTSHGIELLPSEDKTEGAVTVAGRTGKAGRSPARARKGK
jgi:hypothetical protein